MLNKTFLTAITLALITTPMVAKSDTSSKKNLYQCGAKTKTNKLYTDRPINLKNGGNCGIFSLRTHTIDTPAITPAKEHIGGGSLAEQQALLNQKIAEENKRIEEENAKRIAENKAEHCKIARMNRENAERTRPHNQADLVQKYEADVAKYCN